MQTGMKVRRNVPVLFSKESVFYVEKGSIFGRSEVRAGMRS